MKRDLRSSIGAEMVAFGGREGVVGESEFERMV